MTEIESFLRELATLAVEKAVFSVPTGREERGKSYRKTVVRRTANGYQAEHFTEKQAFHENFAADELEARLNALFPTLYKQAHFVTEAYFYDAKVTKKGKLLTNRTKNTLTGAESGSHDRVKKRLFDVENPPPVFRELGVVGADGKILRAKFDKFRQICRFAELLNDVLKDEKKDELHIVDFGCGKSYLTFAVYCYVTEILHKKAYITGLDLKREVMDDCTAIAQKYGYTDLEFLCMDVKDYRPEKPVDVVISLHACDVATDYALAFAVQSRAAYIFSVPCCQKEAAGMIHTDTLPLLTDYGLIKERFSALATDALRAKLLEREGYAVDVAEFVDFENSPKNMLLRARRKKTSADRYKAAHIREEIESMRQTFGLSLTLEKLLDKGGE